MKNLKRNPLLPVLFLFLAGQSTVAQTPGRAEAKHTQLLKKNTLMIYLGGGITTPGATAQDSLSLKSMPGITLELYKPLLSRPGFTAGISASGNYAGGSAGPMGAMPAAFHVQGQTSTIVVVKESSSPNQEQLGFGAGPQLNISLGSHAIFSPIFQAGYLSISQRSRTAIQTTVLNGSAYDYTLLEQEETKTGGLALIPKFRMQYAITRWLGLWAEGSYLLGPDVHATVRRFTPGGTPNAAGEYNLGQMIEGNMQTLKRSTGYSALGIYAGLVFGIGGGSPRPPRRRSEETDRNATEAACNLAFVDTTCNGNAGVINVKSAWSGITPLNVVSVEVRVGGVLIPASITNNNLPCGAGTFRTHQITINGYAGQVAVIKLRICKTAGDPDGQCCVRIIEMRVPACKECISCNGIGVTNILNDNQTGTTFAINGTVTVSGVQVKKIVAQLESFSCYQRAGYSIPVLTNFEFVPASIIKNVAVLYPFALTSARSNIVVSNYSGSASGTIQLKLFVSNYANKRTPLYKVKLTIFRIDGTFCEKYLANHSN